MEDEDWLVLLDVDGRIAGVDGGAPAGWIGRKFEECLDMPEDVRAAARDVTRRLADPLGASPVHRAHVPPTTDEPGYTLLAIEAILLSLTEVELEPLVRASLEPIARQAEKAGVAFTLQCNALPRSVCVDAAKIGWALATVAGNALRHVRDCFAEGSREGSIAVRVNYARHDRRVRVDVADNGPGMPERVRAWLIEPDPETGRSTGLGLRLVNDVVRAHGGYMLVKTSIGTQVTLWLPTRAVAVE
jgi:signal transduction histidine kinase